MHETAVHDFYDPVQMERIYYPEVELLLKQTTGAEKVVVFDYQRLGGAGSPRII
jgi:hypothetical protein